MADVWHRIGRTGRLGNKGRASSFFDGRDDDKLARPLVKVGAPFHLKFLLLQAFFSNFSFKMLRPGSCNPALAQVLTDAKQPVPDWLGGGRGYGGYY